MSVSKAGALMQLPKQFLVLSTLLCCMSLSASEQVYYRYLDVNGVQVINSSIPPEYAQRGYEVVTRYGRLIKKVDPAMTGEQLARRRSQVELKAWDAELMRRYSSAAEIIEARKRKLQTVNGNIRILSGNVGTIDNRIHRKLGDAADQERAGRSVSKETLTQLKELKVKRTNALEHIKLRQQEMQEIARRFDEDLARFNKISAGLQ